MLNKTRSDSRLAQLTPEQQAERYRRLKTQTYAVVQSWLAQPPPDGLGLERTSTPSIASSIDTN